MGSEANQNNKRILRIFVIFVKLLQTDVYHVSANVAEINNKCLQNPHPGICQNVWKTDSFSFIYFFNYISSSSLSLDFL